MKIDELELERLAEQYSLAHGEEAYARIADEISAAVGMRKWDSAYILQRVQWRVRKLQRLRQLNAQMRLNQHARHLAA